MIFSILPVISLFEYRLGVVSRMITVAILNPGGKRKQADVNAKITCLINHREQMDSDKIFQA